ncbi:unnamed protein product [Debaryomyces tyrocola]|nr:unnamed protein product [Debaryomyces tyrocola]
MVIGRIETRIRVKGIQKNQGLPCTTRIKQGSPIRKITCHRDY